LSHPSLDLSESSLSSESFNAGLLAPFLISADPLTHSESSSDSPESSLSSESSEAGLLAAFSTSADPLTHPDSPESTSGSSVTLTDSLESFSHPSSEISSAGSHVVGKGGCGLPFLRTKGFGGNNSGDIFVLVCTLFGFLVQN
jgi:hypothetical protein